eukprot:gene2914-3348_t
MIKALNSIKEFVYKMDEEEKKAGQIVDIAGFERSYKSIQTLVNLQNNYKKFQKPDATPVMTDAQVVETFKEWVVKNGCTSLDNVKITRTLNEGTGLVATKEIKEGEEFLVVPQKMFMTQETAFKSFGDKIQKVELFKQMPVLMLVVHIIQEAQNKTSFWAPYLRMLPKTYKTALYFTLEEVQSLEGSPVQEEAIGAYRNAMRQYCFLYNFFSNQPGVIGTAHFTWEMFIWALSTVMSRQNQIPYSVGVQGMQMALVPMWDLCNHLATGKITTFYETDRQAFTCAAVKTFKANDQVFIHYGDRTNGKLLLYSGFALKSNPYESYQCRLTLASNDPGAHDKTQVLRGSLIANNMAVTLPANPNSLPEMMIPFFRVAVMTANEAAKNVPAAGSDPSELAHNVISEENENAAFKAALYYLKCKLNAYPTKLVEDEQLLAKNPTPIVKYFTYLKIGEKKILERNIKLIEGLIEKGVMNVKHTKRFQQPTAQPKAHGHSHGVGKLEPQHGHSHGGVECHGHDEPEVAPQQHGHSHGGVACHGHDEPEEEEEEEEEVQHGHSHGGVACHGHDEPKVAPQQHGHSHGGVACHGHDN